ncbi:MAG: hypothetical protein EBT22_09065 [Chloroflexi bacterium]|nr:hypothetical protein [Chloroflexota bacterium]
MTSSPRSISIWVIGVLIRPVPPMMSTFMHVSRRSDCQSRATVWVKRGEAIGSHPLCEHDPIPRNHHLTIGPGLRCG